MELTIVVIILTNQPQLQCLYTHIKSESALLSFLIYQLHFFLLVLELIIIYEFIVTGYRSILNLPSDKLSRRHDNLQTLLSALELGSFILEKNEKKFHKESKVQLTY